VLGIVRDKVDHGGMKEERRKRGKKPRKQKNNSSSKEDEPNNGPHLHAKRVEGREGAGRGG